MFLILLRDFEWMGKEGQRLSCHGQVDTAAVAGRARRQGGLMQGQ